MQNTSGSYITTFQVDHFHKTVRYHWMICLARNPDRLVSWGYAPTQELAVSAAENELAELCSGLTEGGRVRDKVIIHRRSWRES